MVERRAVGRVFWLRWVLANLLGMAAAQIAFLSLVGYIASEGFSPASNPVGALMVLVFAAFLIVGPQAFVLRAHVGWVRSWLTVGVGAWALGLGGALGLMWLLLGSDGRFLQSSPLSSSILVPLAVVVISILLGVLVGMAQGRVFGRRRRAWVVANSIALPLSLPLMLFFAGGLAYGALTGIMLMRLLRMAVRPA